MMRPNTSKGRTELHMALASVAWSGWSSAESRSASVGRAMTVFDRLGIKKANLAAETQRLETSSSGADSVVDLRPFSGTATRSANFSPGLDDALAVRPVGEEHKERR